MYSVYLFLVGFLVMYCVHLFFGGISILAPLMLNKKTLIYDCATM